MAGDEAERDELERAVDALYASDPDGFVAARDRLAAELRREGRRDEARQVARLRRPNLAAWAVDHLALTSPESVDALVAAGERLWRAQEEALSGGDRQALHRAADDRRTLIAALANEALAALRERGSGEAHGHREEIEATLEAASSDAEVAALVRRGRLVTPLPRRAGFAGLLDLTAPLEQEDPAAGQRAVEEGAHPEDEDLEHAREEVTRLERLALEAEGDAAEKHRAAEKAAAEVERLESELAGARARATAATEQATQAQARAEAARTAADAAADRLRRPEVGQ